MKAAVYEYRLPLVHPLNLMGVPMTTRRGFLIELRDGQNVCGWGEVAPFPGLHRETPAQAKAQLLACCQSSAIRDFANALTSHKDITALNANKHKILYPSVKFGLESAVLNLRAWQSGVSLSKWLNPAARSEVSLNGLLTGEKETLTANLQRLLEQRFPAIKVKVGRLPVAQEAALVNDISRQLPPGVQLRLDANRRWCFDEAVDFSRRIDISRIEYVEEPLLNTAELPQLHEITRLPIALDESLAECLPEKLTLFAGVVALVIKPAVAGGISAALRWANLAKTYRISAVISSVFDSGLGISNLANIAAAVNDRDVPAGLDTYAWLAADVLHQPLHIENGKIRLSSLPEIGTGTLHMQHLELVYSGG